MPDDADAQSIGARFELVAFSEPTGIPHGWDAELLATGVPKSLFGLYEAANKLTLLEMPHDGQFVCFGTSGLHGSICLDPRTGAVVYINTLEGKVLAPPFFVNSSLEQFIASVRAVLARFPFDRGVTGQDSAEDGDEDRILDELEDERYQAVVELGAALRRIDPAVGTVPRDGFWMTFLGDVQMGDFSTRSSPHRS